LIGDGYKQRENINIADTGLDLSMIRSFWKVLILCLA